jgi:preprotein translocase subunit SecG
MENVLLTIHLIACIAMTGVIMLQRSEGGVQGMSGGGTGGLISGRGAASVLVRTTMICAGIFFITSLVMVRLNNVNSQASNPYQGAVERQNQQGDGLVIPSTPDPFAAPSGVAPAIPAPTTSAPVDPFAAPASPTGSPSAAAPTTAAPAPAPAPATTTAAPATPAPSPQ